MGNWKQSGWHFFGWVKNCLNNVKRMQPKHVRDIQENPKDISIEVGTLNITKTSDSLDKWTSAIF